MGVSMKIIESAAIGQLSLAHPLELVQNRRVRVIG
jgi:hypothetical protein